MESLNQQERARALSFVDAPVLGANNELVVQQNKYGEHSMNNGGGAIREVNGITLKDLEEQEEEEKVGQAFDTVEEVRRKNEELWDKSNHTIGNIEMSGEEWDEAYENLSDPDKRAQIKQALMKKKGWSEERAKKATEDALRLAQIAQKEKDGTITAADKAEAEQIARDNPDAAVAVKLASSENMNLKAAASPQYQGANLSENTSTRSGEIENIYKAGATNIEFDSAKAAKVENSGPKQSIGSGVSLTSTLNPDDKLSKQVLTTSFNPESIGDKAQSSPPSVKLAVNNTAKFDMDLGV